MKEIAGKISLMVDSFFTGVALLLFVGSPFWLAVMCYFGIDFTFSVYAAIPFKEIICICLLLAGVGLVCSIISFDPDDPRKYSVFK